MEDIIKSALEIAQEKLQKLGDATPEERLGWKYEPKGEELGARFMRDDCNLLTELGHYQENERKYVVKGAVEVLLRNITLPKNDAVKKNNRKAMDALKLLKNDKTAVENVYSKVRYLFGHYEEQGEQQRKQAYESLKTDMTDKLQQALQQQTGSVSNTKIDVERQPQFQQEWRKLQNQLDSAYLTHLNEYKHALAAIA